jgi:hypothetical protein
MIVRIEFVGGNTGQGGSPRIYKDADSGDFIVQGYLVEDPADLAQLKVPAGETVVRVPVDLFNHLPEEVRRGLAGL